MINTSLNSYGFNYEFDGKRFAFHILAATEEEAKQAVKAMSAAVFVGKLEIADDIYAPNDSAQVRPGRSEAKSRTSPKADG